MFYVYVETARDYNDDGIGLVFTQERKLPIMVTGVETHEEAKEKALDKAFAWYPEDDDQIVIRIVACVKMTLAA